MSHGRTGRLPTMDEGSDTTVLVCRLDGRPDLAVLDALARLHLAARRSGMRCELVSTGCDLAELLDLAGLSGLLRQPRRQAEPREQPTVVEEVVQVDDPPA